MEASFSQILFPFSYELFIKIFQYLFIFFLQELGLNIRISKSNRSGNDSSFIERKKKIWSTFFTASSSLQFPLQQLQNCEFQSSLKHSRETVGTQKIKVYVFIQDPVVYLILMHGLFPCDIMLHRHVTIISVIYGPTGM